jgi:hypothetical protein
MRIQERSVRAGRIVATGSELQALATMLDIHDQIITNSTRVQIELALREIAVRIQRKHVYPTCADIPSVTSSPGTGNDDQFVLIKPGDRIAQAYPSALMKIKASHESAEV